MEALLAYIKQQLALIQLHISQMTPVLYTIAKNNLGNHLTLDNAIPADVGCAECVSKILSLAGIPIPATGIPGTASLCEWLQVNPRFKEVFAPSEGVVIISPTEGVHHGHTGILGGYGVMYSKDWGIMSNDSDTGILREKWSLKAWEAYYGKALGLSIFYFTFLG